MADVATGRWMIIVIAYIGSLGCLGRPGVFGTVLLPVGCEAGKGNSLVFPSEPWGVGVLSFALFTASPSSGSATLNVRVIITVRRRPSLLG